MSRYIDAEKIKFEPIDIIVKGIIRRTIERMATETEINAIPTADVEEVRRGLWEEVTVEYNEAADIHIASMRCSVCKRYHNEIYIYGDPTESARYCNFCGALNREVKQ